MSVLSLAWARYLDQLDKRPLRTKALTAGALSGASDILAQRLTSRGPVNWRRTLAIALFGFLWSGPSNHYWQQFLQRLFRGKRQTSATIMQKVAIDQLVYGPICNALLMSYLALVVEGRSLSSTSSKLQRELPMAQLNGWKVWPLASVINFLYVPLKLRPLFVNLVAFGWSTFLITRSKGNKP